MLTCKQATKLMSQTQEKKLSLRKHVTLRLHLTMCSGCKNYNKQMDFIRKACRHIGGSEGR